MLAEQAGRGGRGASEGDSSAGSSARGRGARGTGAPGRYGEGMQGSILRPSGQERVQKVLGIKDYNSRISSLGKEGKWSEAIKLFEDLPNLGFQPTEVRRNFLGGTWKHWQAAILAQEEKGT